MSKVTTNKNDNLATLKVISTNIKPCKKHHYFLDIDIAYDKFNENLKNDNDFYNKWHRKPINSPFEVGVKYTGNQLKAFFEWYVNTGGQAIPF